jgi:hypothetical protein
MITKVVAKLKTGTITNVVPYGYGIKQAPPYVVVKREAFGNFWRWRIIAHVKPGQNITLDDYLFEEVPTLLNGFSAETRNGNTQMLDDYSNEFQDIAPQSDDGTISAERIFYSPHILF